MTTQERKKREMEYLRKIKEYAKEKLQKVKKEKLK
jgi:hypothetical protein